MASIFHILFLAIVETVIAETGFVRVRKIVRLARAIAEPVLFAETGLAMLPRRHVHHARPIAEFANAPETVATDKW